MVPNSFSHVQIQSKNAFSQKSFLQNPFKSQNNLFKSRNRFMSSESCSLLNIKQTLMSQQTFQQNNSSFVGNSLNPENDLSRNQFQEVECNSAKTNYSSRKSSQNPRKRHHALRKCTIDNSLSKFQRERRSTLAQRLSDYRIGEGSNFNKISLQEFQSGSWKVSTQQQETSIIPVENEISFPQTSMIIEPQNPQNPDQVQCFPKENGLTIPERKIQDFITEIQIQNQLHDDFNPGEFKKFPELKYESRYELYYPRNVNDQRIFTSIVTKNIQGLKVISINCGKNLNNATRKIKKISYKTKKGNDMRQMIDIILGFMSDGYDFILLQQACDPSFQKYLVDAIIAFNRQKGDIYFFPQHMQRDIKDHRTTTILTKHQVKMGQFRFLIEQIEDYPNFKPRLPTQTYCEFTMKINERWQNVCIFNCHLKSSNGHKIQLFSKIRKEQIEAIQKFSKNYSRFFCIGDTNIPSSFAFYSENDYVTKKFYDAINYGISQYRGTYLFKTPKGKVVEERIDRVWLDRQSALTTSVLINYHDILLQSCQNLDLDQISMIEKGYDTHPYITVTDHTILDIEIMFTK